MINTEKYKKNMSKSFRFYDPVKIKKQLMGALIFALCVGLLAGCTQQNNEVIEEPTVQTEVPEAVDTAGNEEIPNGADETNRENTDNGFPQIVEQVVTDLNIFEFVTLGQYRGIEFDYIAVEPVTDADVDALIEEHMSQAVEMVEITDRAVAEGDTVTIDFAGYHDGIAFEGGTAHGFDLMIGSGRFIPGFEEQIIGHNVGDEFDIHLSFPEDYFAPELAGQDVIFKITLHAITIESIPELTDEFLQENLGIASIEEYRTIIHDQLTADRQFDVENTIKAQLWRAVMDNATIHKVPEGEVDSRIETSLEEVEFYAAMYGLELEDLINQVTGMTMDEFIRLEVIPSAVRDVSHELVLRAVAAQAGLVVSQDEFDESVRGFIEQFGFESEEQFFETHGEQSVRMALLSEKVIEFVLEHAVAR